MPEGDTIHRTAARLRPALEGRTVHKFRAQRLASSRGPKSGTRIDSVEAVGKYLLIHFGNGTTLETHMKMSGSWHLYETGKRWGRSAGAARVVIETTEGWTAVCFSANHVKILGDVNGTQPVEPARYRGPDHLGPDLCSPNPDLDDAVKRFSTVAAQTPIAVVLLDQRVCCGVGNVYKSEVLFACSIHPDRRADQVTVDERHQLVETSHLLLRANLGSGPRTTVPEGLAIYGRRGLPCRSCQTPISYGHHGIHARSTYWCEVCQQ